jgi:hypothetical protein
MVGWWSIQLTNYPTNKPFFIFGVVSLGLPHFSEIDLFVIRHSPPVTHNSSLCLMSSLPTLLAHADWSVQPQKRWLARATLQTDADGSEVKIASTLQLVFLAC